MLILLSWIISRIAFLFLDMGVCLLFSCQIHIQHWIWWLFFNFCFLFFACVFGEGFLVCFWLCFPTSQNQKFIYCVLQIFLPYNRFGWLRKCYFSYWFQVPRTPQSERKKAFCFIFNFTNISVINITYLPTTKIENETTVAPPSVRPNLSLFSYMLSKCEPTLFTFQ